MIPLTFPIKAENAAEKSEYESVPTSESETPTMVEHLIDETECRPQREESVAPVIRVSVKANTANQSRCYSLTPHAASLSPTGPDGGDIQQENAQSMRSRDEGSVAAVNSKVNDWGCW